MLGIIGASGFIGRSVSDYFAANRTPFQAYMRAPDLAPRNAFAGANRITALETGAPFDPAIFDGVRTVLLTASATRPNTPKNDVANEVAQNVLPYCTALEALRKTSVKHVIYLSSGGAVYGNGSAAPQIAETEAVSPASPYGYGKYCIEAAVRRVWQGDGRTWTILRPSNPVGPHQMATLNSQGLFTTVFHNIWHDRRIEVFGDGAAVRDYFDVRDLAALIHAIHARESGQNVVLNVSSGSGLSVIDVIDICAGAIGKRPVIHYNTNLTPDIPRNVLSSDLAFERYGWRAQLGVTGIIQALNNALTLAALPPRQQARPASSPRLTGLKNRIEMYRLGRRQGLSATG